MRGHVLDTCPLIIGASREDEFLHLNGAVNGT